MEKNRHIFSYQRKLRSEDCLRRKSQMGNAKAPDAYDTALLSGTAVFQPQQDAQIMIGITLLVLLFCT